MSGKKQNSARFIKRCLGAAALMTSLAMNTQAAEPLSTHPDNPRYFLFNGKPTVLVGSSEHYGALINLDFDYVRYLDEVKSCGLNYVRIFSGTYRETTGSFNIPDNTLSPLVGRSVAPWKRTEIPGAGDGGNKFDLTQWDPAYFHRLRDIAKAASTRGIVVELTLFSSIYDDTFWNLSPLKSTNHINGVGAGGRAACFSPTGDLLPFQKALARKCATELQNADNVFFEICNEPYQQNVPEAWENQIISELADAESNQPKRHLIARNIYNYQGIISNPNPAVSIFNFHYAYPNAASSNQNLNVALGNDETGFAGREDFPYRREAWEFMLSGGALFNHLDFSFTATREDGNSSQIGPSGGGPALRRQLGILRWFLEELPLTALAPQPGFISNGIPSGGAAVVMGAPGSTYALYLRGGTQAQLVVNLPAGIWRGQWIDTRSGLASGSIAEFTHSGGSKTLSSPSYTEDIALRLFGGESPPPEIVLTSPTYNMLVPSSAANVTLSASAAVTRGTLQEVEFFDGDKSLGIANAAPYQITATGFAAGPHVFRAIARTTDGRKASSFPIRVSVVGPFQSGVNLNGGTLLVDGQTLQSQTDATASGLTITNVQPTTTAAPITFYPTPDAPTGLLLNNQLARLSATGNAKLGISYPVPDGHYDVYLFLVEDQTSYSRNMRLDVEGQTLASSIGEQAKGEWHKYGPYRTQVADGKLDIGLQQDTKGVPKIAAFTIYQANAPTNFLNSSLDINHSDGVVLLSYPSGFPTAKLEASDTLAEAWEPITSPVSNFENEDLFVVPMDRPTRFFRLRMD